MNTHEHALTCLAEECLEVAKEISKALRFGLDDRLTTNPAGPRGTEGPTNREKIVAELNDILGAVRVLEAFKIIPQNWKSPDAQSAKAEKIANFMEYAARVGTLQPVTS